MAIPLHEFELARERAISILAEADRNPQDAVELTRLLREIILTTTHIAQGLNDPQIQELSGVQLLDLATKLDKVVAFLTHVLVKSRLLELAFLDTQLKIVEEQRERLDSLAETFRMGADPAARAHTHKLIQEADGEAKARTSTNWRDLVGSLHD